MLKSTLLPEGQFCSGKDIYHKAWCTKQIVGLRNARMQGVWYPYGIYFKRKEFTEEEKNTCTAERIRPQKIHSNCKLHTYRAPKILLNYLLPRHYEHLPIT